MLFSCWPSVADGGPTIKQHCINIGVCVYSEITISFWYLTCLKLSYFYSHRRLKLLSRVRLYVCWSVLHIYVHRVMDHILCHHFIAVSYMSKAELFYSHRHLKRLSRVRLYVCPSVIHIYVHTGHVSCFCLLYRFDLLSSIKCPVPSKFLKLLLKSRC